MLQHHRLARPRGGDDQATLAFADRCQQIDDARRIIFGLIFETEAFIGVERGEIIEKDFFPSSFWLVIVDRFNLDERAGTFPFLGGADVASDNIPCSQVESTNLARRNVNIVRSGKIVVIGSPEKTKTIG